MSPMDKLPQNTNSLTSTTSSTSTTTHWDLAMASMDANHHHHHQHHQIFHDLQNQAPFNFSSLPTWSNYSPLPPNYPPSSSSSLSLQGSRTMAKQMKTLVEGDEKEEEQQLVEEEQEEEEEEEDEELGAVKEMMYKIAAMQPVEIDPDTIRRPKRRNVRISDDPQSVAARLRRERISEKIRILQRLVPGGTKLDTASMLEEAVRYVKFLKRQIRHLQTPSRAPPPATTAAPSATTSVAAAHHRGFEGELPLCFSFNEAG